jgi:hypothetical protein
MEKITTKILITPPGTANANGVIIDPESDEKVMNSERTKEMIEDKAFFLVSYVEEGTININLKYVIGTIINWTSEYIEVEMDNQKFTDYIVPLGENCIAGIIGCGRFNKDKMFELSYVNGFQLLTGKYKNIMR